MDAALLEAICRPPGRRIVLAGLPASALAEHPRSRSATLSGLVSWNGGYRVRSNKARVAIDERGATEPRLTRAGRRARYAARRPADRLQQCRVHLGCVLDYQGAIGRAPRG